MQTLSLTNTNIPGTTPVLVFSGTGKVRLSGQQVIFGDSAVAYNGGLGPYLTLTQVFEFSAPVEIYAACYGGSTNQVARVEAWY